MRLQADLANVAERMAGLAVMANVVNAEARAERYDFKKLGGHASEQLLLEMLKAVGCREDDGVYQGLVEHIAAAERQRARGRTRLRRERRGRDA